MRRHARMRGQRRGQGAEPLCHRGADVASGEELRPTDAAGPANIGRVHMEMLDGRDGDAAPRRTWS